MTSIASSWPANAPIGRFEKDLVRTTIKDVTEVAAEDEDDWVYPYPTNFKIHNHPIDKPERAPLNVVIVGAGLAGITAAILLPIKVPGIKLTILEKNADVGGTWYENIYPGVRCDVPANVYQSTFDPNTQWSEEFAQGREICDYWQRLSKKHGVYEKTKFQTAVIGAHWLGEEGQWQLATRDLVTGKESNERYDFFITAIGHFNEWKLPEYPGIEDYQGHLRHSSNWDPTFDPIGKKVAIIGNGASGIQLTPELQKVAQHVDHYARSRTWIAGSLGGLDRLVEPMRFSAERLKEFADDPAAYLKFRKALEETYWHKFEGQIRNSEASKNAKADFRKLMADRLIDKPELLDRIVPDFPPNCRRLTPGPGYLEALTKENVSYITTPIERFTKDGIVTMDGVHRPVDAVICSTGANVDFAPTFPIVAGKVDLQQAWRPGGVHGFPYSYLGVATPGFPNALWLHGPNGSGAAGPIPHCVETQVTYMAKLLRKVASQGIKTVVPRKDATDDFVEYCDAFFPHTNLSRKCSSWANGRNPGARIHGLWPGSAAHVTHVRREPRWEDWEYTHLTKENRFAYWGNGWTSKELDPDSDMTPHLKLPSQIDLRDVHESWWDL